MDSKLAYQEYLKTYRWQELKAQALTLAGYKCQVCNSPLKLDVHHREYPRTWGEEPVSFLTVLCHKCHMLFHKKKPAKKYKPASRKRIPRTEKRRRKREKELQGLIEDQRADALMWRKLSR